MNSLNNFNRFDENKKSKCSNKILISVITITSIIGIVGGILIYLYMEDHNCVTYSNPNDTINNISSLSINNLDNDLDNGPSYGSLGKDNNTRRLNVFHNDNRIKVDVTKFPGRSSKTKT